MTKHLSDDHRRGALSRCWGTGFGPQIARYGIQAMTAALVAAVLLGSGNSTWATEGEPDGSAREASAQATATAQPEAEKESRAPAYTVEMTAEHTAQVSRSPYVAPTPSADEHFVIGQTKGWPENPAIPPQDLLAYQITDPAATGEKIRVVLTTGNHNTEHSGSWAFQGMVDFLISDEPEAAALRRKAVFYVYPLVNPDGRFTRQGRGNPELAAAGIKDHNRVWHTSGEFTTIDIVTAAMRKDTGGSADYVLDFHSTSSNHFRVVKDFADSPYSQAITARDPTIKPHVLVGHPGQVRRWGASEDGLGAGFSTSTEHSHAISVERCLEIGRTYGLALYDVVVP
ncbi:MAG: M14 family zinc carboxypeptidase [Thermoguttaceae bacterium]|jgi:hypothetical protein|nr:M14 family zinc carboxypeptidase [Thermoguttaceae bacterium]